MGLSVPAQPERGSVWSLKMPMPFSAEPTGPQQGKGACPHSFQLTMDGGERALGRHEGRTYLRALTGLSATAVVLAVAQGDVGLGVGTHCVGVTC